MLFVALFLGIGVYFHLQGVEFAFYQIPAPIAAIPAIILALWLSSKRSFEDKLAPLIKGMGESNVITMCLIYLLAGAFSSVVKASGGVESAVNLGLHFTPDGFLLPALFLISSLLSLAMGTSMGTISALGPIALGIYEQTGIDQLALFGALVGGAMFGDNLSFISDTTIAATRTQGARMKDKFHQNFKLALPAALLTIILLILVPKTAGQFHAGSYSYPQLLPYAVLLFLALLGINVFVVLFAGIICAGLTASAYLDNFTFQYFAKLIFDGFKDMQEIFILSMMMGGLGQMMKEEKGIEILQNGLKRFTQFFGEQSHFKSFFTELSLAISVTLTNVAVANNTVAILICGDFIREASRKENIPPARSASILDIFSCITQGLIPYGAQILLASQLAKINPLDLIRNVTYCYLLALTVLLNMAFHSVKIKTQRALKEPPI